MSEELIARFEEAGQGHVFRFWDELDEGARGALIDQAEGIDLAEVDRLNTELVQGDESGEGGDDFTGLEPAEFSPLPANGGDAAGWAAAEAEGVTAFQAGRVAAFTVAGGQGTRLGFDAPKGTFPVTPVRNATLFQVFAEKISAASSRYGKPIPWFVMTSVINHEATETFFRQHDFFGLDPDQVHLFRQGLMPAVDYGGKIMLKSRGEIAMSPDGHGGALRALVRSGATATMAAAGIDIVSYFQVDNPLVRCIDPAFIGFHLQAGSEMSSKAVPKAYAAEKVGVFCRRGGRTEVVEYSDLPEEHMSATDDAGELLFRGGSIAIHLLSREFIERMGGGGDTALPFHRADKKVPTVDAEGAEVLPEEANGVKFEMFVFDALPSAANPVIIETAREDDFSPVKNAEGADSPQTSKDDQLRLFARWANAAGADLPTDDTGLPEVCFEVTPAFGDSAATFAASWAAADPKPAIVDGAVL